MTDSVSRSFKGVRRRESGKWTSEIRDPIQKKQLWIGSFNTAEAAAMAYDVVSFYFRRSTNSLNFPEAVLTLPAFPPNSTIDEILRLAHEYSAAAVSDQTLTGGNAEMQIYSIDSQFMEGISDFYNSGGRRSGGGSISGVTELGLVDEEIGSGDIAPIAATVPTMMSESEIQFLREMPMYSPDYRNFDLFGGGGVFSGDQGV